MRSHPTNPSIRPRLCIFPGYRWCGPGCTGPGAPINAVDAACRAHDLCYRNEGPSCRCDLLFIHRLERLVNEPGKEGSHARVIYHYMKLQTSFKC
ncbi:phospholipase [Pontibacillus salicampi]|uniref:Phospholipase n=1 Tax=Pontibacillus salicampi TaxID=1449801 RepID=A0ABV6LR55_9BACI